MELELATVRGPPCRTFGELVMRDGVEGAHRHLEKDKSPERVGHWRVSSGRRGRRSWNSPVWQMSSPKRRCRSVRTKANQPPARSTWLIVRAPGPSHRGK